jgi:hypothetical protein
LLCRHEAGEETSLRIHSRSHHVCSIRSPGGRPQAQTRIGTFASVGRTSGIPSANEEDVLFGTTVVLPHSTEAVSLSARPCMTTALPRPTNSVNDNGGAIFLRVRWLGLEPDLVPAGDMAKVWRTLLLVGGWLE